jgi:hypothetical protein
MHTSTKIMPLFAGLTLFLTAVGCGDDEKGSGNENEVITTVTLTFTPSAGGTPIVARFNDPDGNGGGAPTIDPINLTAGMFDLSVTFENRLETPPANITEEVEDEADEHQVFFTGSAVNGPASNQANAPLIHAYTDMDAKGLPLGLANGITARKGTGTLTVTLRHMPPANNMPVKTASAADMVRASGFSAIGGSTDAQVNFPVTVP